MTDTITLPMPGDTYVDGEYGPATVIASCWRNDDPEQGPTHFVLLLLVTSGGLYYRLTEVQDEKATWRCSYENIIPASEAYSEAIGGY